MVHSDGQVVVYAVMVVGVHVADARAGRERYGGKLAREYVSS